MIDGSTGSRFAIITIPQGAGYHFLTRRAMYTVSYTAAITELLLNHRWRALKNSFTHLVNKFPACKEPKGL